MTVRIERNRAEQNRAGAARLDDLVAVLREPTDPAGYPHADRIDRGVLVYHADALIDTPPAELVTALADGPGVVVIESAFDRPVVEHHHVQLPLTVGDAVFFNPAVIHGAGANRTTGTRRSANLLQVSSAFGRAMETVDRERVCGAVYPALLVRAAHDPDGARRALAAAAEGYPFPTDLDADPPTDGLAPPSQADLVRRALDELWLPGRLTAALAAQSARRGSHPGRSGR